MRESGKLALQTFRQFLTPVCTAPLILRTLMKAVAAVTSGERMPRFVFSDTTMGRHLRRAVNAQEHFYSVHHRDLKVHSGQPWLSRVLRGMWRIMNLQWNTRNGILHDTATGMEVEEKRWQIRCYYLNPHTHVANEDIDLF